MAVVLERKKECPCVHRGYKSLWGGGGGDGGGEVGWGWVGVLIVWWLNCVGLNIQVTSIESNIVVGGWAGMGR